ncbi:MAG: hypothetical protein QXE50_05785 [Nitrososphaerota archaeon]
MARYWAVDIGDGKIHIVEARDQNEAVRKTFEWMVKEKYTPTRISFIGKVRRAPSQHSKTYYFITIKYLYSYRIFDYSQCQAILEILERRGVISGTLKERMLEDMRRGTLPV